MAQARQTKQIAILVRAVTPLLPKNHSSHKQGEDSFLVPLKGQLRDKSRLNLPLWLDESRRLCRSLFISTRVRN